MARNPDSLATYEILESYVKMIAKKCSLTYSKKIDTIKKIECAEAIPTGSSSTTKVICLICTYDDGTVINIDASPITSGVSDVVSKSYLTSVLNDYVSKVNLNTLISGYTNTVDLEANFLKKVDAYSPTNKSTLDLLTQDSSGNLLFNGSAITSSSGGTTINWADVASKPFSDIDTSTLSVVGDKLTVTGGIILDSTLSDTSTNGVQNKVVAEEFKKYTNTSDLTILLTNYVKTTDLTSALTGYTDTATLSANYALKTDLHSHSNKTVLDDLSDDGGNLKYGTDVLLTTAIISGLISESDADLRYIAKANIETDTLDLTTL